MTGRKVVMIIDDCMDIIGTKTQAKNGELGRGK